MSPFSFSFSFAYSKFAARLSLLAALAGPAFALQTNKVELGVGGAYDGLVKIERDAEGRMIFTDAQNPGDSANAVTLSQLLGTGAQANTIIVAKERGQFDNLAQAYEAVPDGGVVLVYPGEYTLTDPLILNTKSCAFVALEAAATRLVMDSTSDAFIIGAADAPTGSEDWDDPETYTPVGHLLFEGFTFEAPAPAPAILIRAADMSAGSLTLRHCRFIASRGVRVLATDEDGRSIGLQIAVESCVFEPQAGAMESALTLVNRSLSGDRPARYIIRDNVINPAAAPRPEPSEAAPLNFGFEISGQHVSATVEANQIYDTLHSILLTESANGRAQISRNTIRLDNPGPELPAPAFGITLSGASSEFELEANQIDIRDIDDDDAPCAGVGLLFSDAACVVRSRANIIDVTGPDAEAAFYELDGSSEFELRTADDIWSGASLTEGTLVVEPTGDRRFRQLRLDGLVELGAASTPSAATDAALLFARDTAGTTELFVKDEAGNETQLSSHAEPPGGFRPDDPMPHTISSSNEFIGKEVIIYLSAAIRRLEQLTGEKFIWTRDLLQSKEWTRKDQPPPAWIQRRLPSK